MRILHVTDAASGGVLAALTALAGAQSTTPGNEVHIAYVARPDSPTADEIATRARCRVECWSADGSLRELVRGLSRELACGGWDVIHLHSTRAGLIGRALGTVLGRRGRLVYSPHGFAFTCHRPGSAFARCLLWLERLGTALGPRLILVSPSEEAVAKRSLIRARTAVLANAVDAAALHQQSAALRRRPAPLRRQPAGGPQEGAEEIAPGTGSPPLRIVHIGRIVPQKAPGEFAHAIGILRKRGRLTPGQEVEAVWIGDGDRQLLGDEPITVTGWLPPDQVRATVLTSDLMMFSSVGEGLPMAIIEAQGLGIPVVASPVVGVTDLVEDGVTGLHGEDAAGLAAAAERILSDPALRDRIIVSARAAVARNFDVATLADRSLRVYRSLLDGLPA